jgi:Na+-transporting methylmalonyl-CoA/oxaloacetate decarboxylase gamma subunit
MSSTVDWGYALTIAGTGFGVVFLVLSTVAAALWAIGLVVRRVASQGEKKESTGS